MLVLQLWLIGTDGDANASQKLKIMKIDRVERRNSASQRRKTLAAVELAVDDAQQLRPRRLCSAARCLKKPWCTDCAVTNETLNSDAKITVHGRMTVHDEKNNQHATERLRFRNRFASLRRTNLDRMQTINILCSSKSFNRYRNQASSGHRHA